MPFGPMSHFNAIQEIFCCYEISSALWNEKPISFGFTVMYLKQ